MANVRPRQSLLAADPDDARPSPAGKSGATWGGPKEGNRSMSLREAGAITGVGETKYLRGTDRTALSFQLEASLNAIRDAGLKPIRHRRADPVRPRRRGRGLHHQFRHPGPALLRDHADGRRVGGGLDPVRAGGHPGRHLQARAAVARAAPAIPAAASARACSRCRSSASSASSRCRSAPSPRPSSTPRWRGGTWSSTAPRPANWPRSP